MLEFLGGRGLEIGDLDAGRIDELEQRARGAVLAARVHALQDDDERAVGVGVELGLEVTDAPEQLVGRRPGLFLGEPEGLRRIEVFDTDLGLDLDGLAHGLNRRARAGVGKPED